MNRYVKRGWRPMVGALAVGAIVFGLSLQGAPAGDSAELASLRGVDSAGAAATAAAVSVTEAELERRPERVAAPIATATEQKADTSTLVVGQYDENLRQGRIISGVAVPGAGNSSASRGGLALGDPCSCDQDCDQSAANGCNIVQCIVRSLCTGDNSTLCSVDEDCFAAGGVCNPDLAVNVQRCDTVGLIDWQCDLDANFCTLDRCEDDGTGTETSVCAAQDDRGDGTGSPLSPCAKECNAGPNAGRNCADAGDCPGLDIGGNPAACVIRTGGACDTGTESCYVGTPGDLTTAVGRCCDGTGTCTGETTEAACVGDWYRYRSPLQVLGASCECAKYSSGVTPQGADTGAVGLVRPSDLICQVGSDVETQAGRVPVFCETAGTDAKNCQKRCTGGDNATAICQSNVDCGLVGTCAIGGNACVPGNPVECVAGAGDDCIPDNPGTCDDDVCGSNTIEGGCSPTFLNIGDDYSLENGSYLRLTQFRFRGGVENLGEQMVFEIWTSDNATLIDAWAVTPGRAGIHDWAIELDCYPNCDVGLGEIASVTPIIIPPDGIIKLRSPRTIGTLAGSAATWSVTDTVDVGTNNASSSLRNDVIGDNPGENVFIFELLGEKLAGPPLGACCDDGASCEDTLRWECGICSQPPNGDPIGTILCSSTYHDCPQGGLTGSFCQTNRWFGPISNNDFLFPDPTQLTLCNGIEPCDRGACCLPNGTCDVQTEADCLTNSGDFLGIATDCDPNCCPQPATGSDCACETSVCQDDVTFENTDILCDIDADCGAGFSCVVACTPNGTEVLRHSYTCYDFFPTEILPLKFCDPNNGDADCDTGAGETCRQSFSSSYDVVKTDTINSLFKTADGDACTLNIAADNVGWFELFELEDRTPGDSTDDCFQLTVGLCCTDPLLTPIWPFVSQYLECPCVRTEDVEGIAPDFDEGNNQKAGFGPNSLASIPCEDGNYAMTVTLPPGEYGYQINSATNCAGSTTACDDDTDCPGTSCVVPNPDYTVHFSVESCDKAACCLGSSCLVTNKLDCEAQGGAYLGEGDNPIVTCEPFPNEPCVQGSCCVDGNCLDDSFNDEPAECAVAGGIFVGGLECADQPCAACPFDAPANCQQVQTIFGAIPLIDRNTDNGAGGPTVGITRVTADDIIFNGSTVDDICWNAGMYDTNIAGCVQSGGFDNTWEIRVYGPNASNDVIPGAEICFSTLQVLNKVEGTGQATATFQYSGRLNTPCALPNGGPAGDTYWIEISGEGDSGCSVRATWSRDHGNEHSVWQAIDNSRARLGYAVSQVNNLDVGFCEDDGITYPAPVLGACCTCPSICTDGVAQSDCLDNLFGVWVGGEVCANNPCPGDPPNDDCSSPTAVAGVPDDGTALSIDTNNICATDDGPLLDGTFNGGCRGSITGNGECHDDIWYAYTAEHCGKLTITSCNEADNDQMIAIYDGDAGCPLQTTDELACNDDGCTGSGSAGPSTVEIDVVENQNLLIRVGGWNDEVPGGFNGDPRGFMTLNFSFSDICAGVLPPVVPAGEFQKNRYIAVDANTPNAPVTQYHLRATVTASEVTGANLGDVVWAGDPDGDCVSIMTKTKPATAPDFAACPTVYLTSCVIIPTTTYDIHTVSVSDEVSDTALTVSTQAKPGPKWWGDIVGSFDAGAQEWTQPNQNTNIDDAVACIKTFQDPNAFNATHLSVSDLQPHGDPNTPFGTVNKIVNIGDCFGIILGFQGTEFPGFELSSCP